MLNFRLVYKLLVYLASTVVVVVVTFTMLPNYHIFRNYFGELCVTDDGQNCENEA